MGKILEFLVLSSWVLVFFALSFHENVQMTSLIYMDKLSICTCLPLLSHVDVAEKTSKVGLRKDELKILCGGSSVGLKPCQTFDFERYQVWPLTQYFSSFTFCKKKSMTPRREDIVLFCFSQQLPSSPSGTLEGLFELTQCPSRALSTSPRALLPELQRYKDTIRCG